MIKNKKRTTPTFLEGLNGHYQRRESPPPIPGPVSFHQSVPTTGSSTQSLLSVGLLAHHQSTASSAAIQSEKHATSTQLQHFNGAPKPSSSSTSLPMNHMLFTNQTSASGLNNNNQRAVYNNSSQFNNNGNSFGFKQAFNNTLSATIANHSLGHVDWIARPNLHNSNPNFHNTNVSFSAQSNASTVNQPVSPSTQPNVGYNAQTSQNLIQQQRRLSHTPRGSRTVSTRSDLSSHSFSNTTSRHVIQQAQQYPANVRQIYVQNQQLLQQQPPHRVGHAEPTNGRQRCCHTSSSSIGNAQHNADVFDLGASNDSKYHGDEVDLGQKWRFDVTGSLQSLLHQNQHIKQQKRRESTSPGLSASAGHASNDPNEILLPNGWEVDMTLDGIRFYIDHNNQRTSWIHPLAIENLPPGWTKIFDLVHGVVYYNENEQRSQFEHPGLVNDGHVSQRSVHKHYQSAQASHNAQQSFHKKSLQELLACKRSTSWANLQQQQHHQNYSNQLNLAQRIKESASIQSIAQHQLRQDLIPPDVEQSLMKHEAHFNPIHPLYYETVGSLNIINEDIPEWLTLYGEAPFQSDHLLNWSLFKLPQLTQFDRMLRKLYKQEVLNTVSKYERTRAEINLELLRRFHST